jgi:hypothetical protein
LKFVFDVFLAFFYGFFEGIEVLEKWSRVRFWFGHQEEGSLENYQNDGADEKKENSEKSVEPGNIFN